MSGKLNSGMVAIRSNSRKIPLSTAIEKGVKSNGSPRRAKAKRRSKDDRREDPSSLVSGPKIGKGPRKSPVPAGMKIRDESENAKDVLRREEKIKIGKASDSTAKSKEAVKPYEAKRDCSHAQVKEDVGEDRSEDYGSISREDTTRTFTPPSGKLKRRASNQSLQDSEEYHSERIVKRMSNSIKNQDGMRSSRSSSASDRTEDGHDGARQDDSEVHSEEELVNSDVESHLGHLHSSEKSHSGTKSYPIRDVS
ncbi:hypothetical protein KIN20_007291 [Parelaphostrongylus tenuis]|uniref:Uncharacterized protein n=1 Tax=Parelaphostrongylus tenuis TaxID=148309 RepID=A0AAD5M586_PARTN|nr:hypothetical protein KIN20_007291 [Parelaphostrongylus tenuis]